ncbi:MAG TPA: hypothetical protein VFZ78_06950 [Flavisolibacter sp.]
MEKVYRLLRNNFESGPYTIDELMQQQLRETDLVWVEGKSLAWSYPRELEELRKDSPAEKPVQRPKKQTPAVPDEIEKRAEELRQRVMSFQPQQYAIPAFEDPERDTPYLDTRDEEDSIQLVDHRKTKTFSLNELLAAAMVTLIVGAGVYGGRTFLSQSKEVMPVVTKMVHAESNAARMPVLNTGSPGVAAVAPPVADTTQDSTSGTTAYQVPKKAPVKTEVNPEPVEETLLSESVVPDDKIVADNRQEKPQVQNQVKEEEPVKKRIEQPERSEPVTVEKSTTVIVPEPEKKRTLGEALKGIFKKKKSKDTEADTTDSEN